jgi:phosphohistidine phosphatase
MQIYLIRHAHAEEGKEDAPRPLSPRGRQQIRRVGRFLRQNGALAAREFWHSPLVRARDTAVRLTRELKEPIKLVPVNDLEPAADPASMARRLGRVRRSVAVVGHEPQLSALASLLVGGSAAAETLLMKKCAVVALERLGRLWVIRWLVSPDLIP